MTSTVPLLEDDDTIAFGEEDEPKGAFKHPVICLLHVLFRSLALLAYLLCGWFDVSFIGSFVTVLLLLSADFWTTKNITGRIMVGLRWWNHIDEEGRSHWVFEARKPSPQGRVSPTEARLFWGGLVAAPLIWAVFGVVALLTFSVRWLMLVCIALSLSGSNLLGFIRCRTGGGEGVLEGMRGAAAGLMRQQVLANLTALFSKSPPNASTSHSNV